MNVMLQRIETKRPTLKINIAGSSERSWNCYKTTWNHISINSHSHNCTTRKVILAHTMKTHARVEVQLYSLTSTLDGGEWSSSRPGCFCLRESDSNTD